MTQSSPGRLRFAKAGPAKSCNVIWRSYCMLEYGSTAGGPTGGAKLHYCKPVQSSQAELQAACSNFLNFMKGSSI